MNFQITLQPGGYRFPISEQETILDAALKHGCTLPHSCREGVCGVCKGKIVAGQADQGNYLGSALSPAEIKAGMTLFCCATAQSDLQIECAAVSNDIPVRLMVSRVHSMTRLSEDIMALQLELPAAAQFIYQAGQYISILPKDQKPRIFSLANAPHSSPYLELHIRKTADGAFTQHVFNDMKVRDLVRFKGPQGRLRFREGSAKALIFLAGGTGFAPLKALMEHSLQHGLQRPMHLYWGGRRPDDLYMLELVKKWQESGVEFTPVLSEPLPTDAWQGRTGLVHQAVLDDYSTLYSHEVYACGAPAMVEAARDAFATQRGLPKEAFYSE